MGFTWQNKGAFYYCKTESSMKTEARCEAAGFGDEGAMSQAVQEIQPEKQEDPPLEPPDGRWLCQCLIFSLMKFPSYF